MQHKVTITAYKGKLVIDVRDPADALHAMRMIPRGRDSIGDISWGPYDAGGSHDRGGWAFSWFGPVFRIIDPATAVGCNSWHVPADLTDKCTIVGNTVPAPAMAMVDAGAKAWRV